MGETVQIEDEHGVTSVRVLLVDDHDLFRTGLRNLLEERGVQVAGEAGHEDFTARDETGRSIGRVYRHHSGNWYWTMNARGPDIPVCGRGL